jgi:hypothetical protein
VMRAMAPDLAERYQRAPDLLRDVLEARNAVVPRRTPAAGVSGDKVDGAGGRAARDEAHGIQSRLRARETPAPRFCWQCRKPLHARTDRCPFCGEEQ